MGELHMHETLAAPVRETNRRRGLKQERQYLRKKKEQGEKTDDMKCGPRVTSLKAPVKVEMTAWI